MNLELLSQPLINYICEINRIAHQGGNLEMAVVRSTIKRHVEKMYDQAVNNLELTAELNKIRLPLVFFIDHIIKEGPFPFKDQWDEFGRQFNELSGDEKFFDLLDENLNDPSASATERLKVFYQCLGVGFSGCYKNDPDFVERKMRICALRIGINSERPVLEKLSPACYEHTNQQARFVDPAKLIRRIFFIAVMILVVTYVGNVIMFYRLASPMNSALDSCIASLADEENTLTRWLQVFVTEHDPALKKRSTQHQDKVNKEPKSKAEKISVPSSHTVKAIDVKPAVPDSTAQPQAKKPETMKKDK